MKRVPELNEPYIPTRFWGFSGHIQTIVQVQVALLDHGLLWEIYLIIIYSNKVKLVAG